MKLEREDDDESMRSDDDHEDTVSSEKKKNDNNATAGHKNRRGRADNHVLRARAETANDDTSAAAIMTKTKTKRAKQKEKNEKGEATPASAPFPDDGTVDQAPANTKDDGFEADPPLPSSSPSPSPSPSYSDSDPSPLLLSPPEAQFQIFQTVFARDTDGVMYEAVIRRKLYGRAQSQPQQVQIDSSEHDDNLDNDDSDNTAPSSMWHYFVHYNKWNVNWDRWVPETHVYEPTDTVRLYASTLLHEHKTLRSELTRKIKGKKGFQTVEGTEFLQKWRLRMARVDAELHPDLVAGRANQPVKGHPVKPPPPEPQGAPKPKKKVAAANSTNQWTTSALAAERQLRLRGLTGQKMGGDPTASSSSSTSHSHSLILPLALKKHLVDAWEVITQCGMVVALPAPFTVRQALDAYVQSKGVVPLPSNSVGEETTATSATDAAKHPMESASGDDSQPPSASQTSNDLDGDAAAKSASREWHDMADGVALLFDEALPHRLLYREEIPQYHVWCGDSQQTAPLLRGSEWYGVEHLLRLLVRLPEALSDSMDDEALTRSILAKVNDLIRYLHKNQEIVFTQSYRRLTEMEVQARTKLLKVEERKRRRRSVEVVVAMDGSGGAAAPATHKRVNCGPDDKK